MQMLYTDHSALISIPNIAMRVVQRVRMHIIIIMNLTWMMRKCYECYVADDAAQSDE